MSNKSIIKNAGMPTMNLGRNAEQILKKIKTSIINTDIKPGTLLPSVREYSVEFKTSTNTIWRALKVLEQEGWILGENRKGYRLVDRTTLIDTRSFCYVMTQENIMSLNSDKRVYAYILNAFKKNALEKNLNFYNLIMGENEEAQIQTQLENSKCAGFIIDNLSPKLMDWATTSELSCLLIDDWQDEITADTVVQDDFSGGSLAANYLIKQNCKRIAWIGTNQKNHHSISRYGGACSVAHTHGQRFSAELNFLPRSDEMDQAIYQLLSSRIPPDGILALWLPIAESVVKIARQLNLIIGEDFKMVGWCLNEMLEEAYTCNFPAETPPPVITWSAKDMADITLSKLQHNTQRENNVTSKTNVPVKLHEF